MLAFDAGTLLTALLVILAGAELFTNAVEHVGQRYHLSQGLVGSVLAAIATALPETIIPIVAVFFGGASTTVREHVGIGTILGAPLMLASVAMVLIAVFAGAKRGWHDPLTPESSGLHRDLLYFLVAYLIALLALFIPLNQAAPRMLASTALVFIYVIYVRNTVRASRFLVEQGHGTTADAPLLLARPRLRQTLALEIAQLILSLALTIVGAKLFVHGVEQVAQLTGVGVLVLSLLIIPVATEMPEKFNSILWIRRRKDTLAFGNVTGALVFQGTLLPAFGIQLGAWQARSDILLAMALTFAAILWILFLGLSRRLKPLWLLPCGVAYVLMCVLLMQA
ncbi:MAG: sodium:calcium antiporter [Gammaproteobacteria bacterium]|nr:sodium:calcium antiporter [Gammaproteobacteria bacterium]MDE2024668.1 sodium:calcium antiporter [Gammaproteobacteria bacterium]MDE2273845.1 sodium:calcium antiporter [Gammaproteobacteria bacterium]